MAQEPEDSGIGGRMPTIEVSYQDLCRLVGKRVPPRRLKEEGILYAKGEIEDVNGDMLRIDVKDTNRPDLWSAEGIAREIRGRYVSGGLPAYRTKRSGVTVRVDRGLRDIRPFTVCSVARKLRMDDHSLSQLIQLQEKISMTFGRNRREVAIGVYDMSRIKPPIRFTTVRPDGVKFVPLDSGREMTPRQILKEHPKGREFGHLLGGFKEYPIFIDSAGEVLSVPPIINSEYTGKVTRETRDVFIECSGFNLKFLLPALNVIAAALADRGGEIETVRIAYSGKTIETPSLEPREFEVELGYLNRVSGLGLTMDEACRLLHQARYGTKPSGKKIKLLYPAYRQDIMHQRDVIEDAIISYGYNRIEPVIPKLATVGSQSPKEGFANRVSEAMTGLGFQETLSYILTSKKALFGNMNLPEGEAVEIENAVSENWCVFRTWLLPGLLEFLSRNRHVEYPQVIFETGDVVSLDRGRETGTKDESRLAAVMTGNAAGYEDASSMLDALLRELGIRYSLKRVEHRSFIKGRVAGVFRKRKRIGIIGEINPVVLEKWNLEKPVAGFELEVRGLMP
jgi:phenylalanyl-tRNA synthetase beta chain